MKVLILGAGGLMGRHLVRECERRGMKYRALGHQELDITDKRAGEQAVEEFLPEVVINAAARCDFAACEREPEASRRTNLEAPLWWSALGRQRGFQLVLFSSDYIFSGRKQEPYSEESVPEPLSVYGAHKAALEQAIGGEGPELILRTAWIFGCGGKTFMSLLPRLLQERESVSVASGKLGSCLHAATGAAAVLGLLQQGAVGLFNLVHPGVTSWEEFAELCLEELRRMGKRPACREIVRVPFQNLLQAEETPGRRPEYSVLNPAKVIERVGPLPDWQEGLKSYLRLLDL